MSKKRQEIHRLLSALVVDVPTRVPIDPGWEYLRRELYLAAKSCGYWLHILIDKERDELILFRLK